MLGPEGGRLRPLLREENHEPSFRRHRLHPGRPGRAGNHGQPAGLCPHGRTRGEPRSVLGEAEASFIAARDSFYMATVGETGWPYIQHRGGPPGFVRVLDEKTIGFADFRGNRQYISVGNCSRTTACRCSSWTTRTRPG